MSNMARVLMKTALAWEEQGALPRFRRALRRRDQLVLDHLLQDVSKMPGLDLLSNAPLEMSLMKLLVEEQRELLALQHELYNQELLNVMDV